MPQRTGAPIHRATELVGVCDLGHETKASAVYGERLPPCGVPIGDDGTRCEAAVTWEAKEMLPVVPPLPAAPGDLQPPPPPPGRVTFDHDEIAKADPEEKG